MDVLNIHAEEQIRNLDENEDDHQRRIARLEGEIFVQDERIDQLTEDVHGLQTQLAATQNNLVETQNELTETRNDLAVTRIELTKTRNDLVITGNELTETRNGLVVTQIELEETQNDLEVTRNELAETRNDLVVTRNELKETQNVLTETRNDHVITGNELSETRNDLVVTRNELTGTRNDLVVTRNELKETQNVLTETRNDQERTEHKLKELESALHTGQIAFDFEKDLATYIYPHDKKFGSRTIFTNMKKWLEEKKDTLQGSEANEKWKALQVEFSWSSEHERVFFKLLESRKEFAHPTVDRNTVQSQISDDFTDEEKMCVKDIINIIERVNELMQ